MSNICYLANIVTAYILLIYVVWNFSVL